MNETSGKVLVTGGAGFIGSHVCGKPVAGLSTTSGFTSVIHPAAMPGYEPQVPIREAIGRCVGWKKRCTPHTR